MEVVYFTVTRISGDYAELRGDGGLENTVALALLPDGIDAGDRLALRDFAYELA